jgi:hypothetical protein
VIPAARVDCHTPLREAYAWMKEALCAREFHRPPSIHPSIHPSLH